MTMSVKRKTSGNFSVKRNSIIPAGNYTFHITGAELKEVADKVKKNRFTATMTIETETSTGRGYKEKFNVGQKFTDDTGNGEYESFDNRYEEAATFVEKVLKLDTPLDELTPDIVARLKGCDFNADIEHREDEKGAYPRFIYDSVEVIEEVEEEEEEEEEKEEEEK